MLELPPFSMGIGDRFGQQGKAQLQAFVLAKERGIEVTPVWNKSFREHSLVGTVPADVRREADAAVCALNWNGPYFVDADHIGLQNVDSFIEASDFFTIDVAEHIGCQAPQAEVEAFVARHSDMVGRIQLPGLDESIEMSREAMRQTAAAYLVAVDEAGRIYHAIEARKGRGRFVVEISMDETAQPQKPEELLVILAALAEAKIPVQTIAPKFSGRFNKGVDYVGDVAGFGREFERDLAVFAWAVERFGLPPSLKLSVHSGSDKFSLYPVIRECLRRHRAGLHLKTAGTTWLEELTGLALSGGDGLVFAKELYRSALARIDELCGPYRSVIDIDRSALPPPSVVDAWDGQQFAEALRHDQMCPRFNPHFRQLLHVAYKLAPEMGDRYLRLLVRNAETVSTGVTVNILEKHLLPLFGPD